MLKRLRDQCDKGMNGVVAAAVDKVLKVDIKGFESREQKLEVTGFTTMVTAHAASAEAAKRRKNAGTILGKYDVCEAFSFGTVTNRAKTRGMFGGWSLGLGTDETTGRSSDLLKPEDQEESITLLIKDQPEL